MCEEGSMIEIGREEEESLSSILGSKQIRSQNWKMNKKPYKHVIVSWKSWRQLVVSEEPVMGAVGG